MNATPATPSPEEIRHEADTTRAEVDRTLDALQSKLSVRGKLGTAVNAVCPNITTLIRMDHAHVIAAFRRFRSYLPIGRKRALVANVCLALEVHAQLEEEIFYPALREAVPDNDVLNKSEPEHDEMRALLTQLRSMEPESAQYDDMFRRLIRTVLHHVADEETVLLPLAEDVLGDQLGALGWQMTRRHIELLKPHVAELTTTTARTFPVGSAAAVAGVLTLGWLLIRGARHTH
jgi:hemerythrin superfamily protein